MCVFVGFCWILLYVLVGNCLFLWEIVCFCGKLFDFVLICLFFWEIVCFCVIAESVGNWLFLCVLVVVSFCCFFSESSKF